MLEALQFEFMRNALAAGLLAALVCGVVGTWVVVNRVVFISGGIAHAAYGGIGLAVFLGLPPLAGIFGFSLAAALIMAGVTLKARHRADAFIGVLWAVGMALGVIMLDLTPGYNVDLMSYLFGSILTVPGADLWLMAGTAAAVLVVTVYFYYDLMAVSYDEDFARVRGVPVTALYFLLIIMIALCVVMVIRVVGLILVIALLTIPPYISERFSGSLAGMMFLSVILNVVFIVAGLWLSYELDLTTGAVIIMVAGVFFFPALAAARLRPASGA